MRSLHTVHILVLLAVLQLTAACSGKLYILNNTGDCANDPLCCNNTCSSEQYCKQGVCYNNQVTSSCNPANLSVACQQGEQCIDGVCYVAAAVPPQCSASATNGWCDNNNACVNGTCTTIDGNNTCSVSNLTGLCPGAQICVQGYCYFNNNIVCSSTAPEGICPAGQSCDNGVCQSFTQTCSTTNYGGACPTWQTCIEGDCYGPVPPANIICSTANPAGVCPADEVCVGGSCTPFLIPSNPNAISNLCSLANPQGLCAAGAACSQTYTGSSTSVTPRCLALDSNNSCSGAHSGGLCAGGATCQHGVCAESSCASGGWQCAAGSWCINSNCDVLNCEIIHPNGTCSDATLACVQGECKPPTCSVLEPNGNCQQGQECVDGICQLPPCSSDVPNGRCQVNYSCQGGVCVQGPCNPNYLQGTCSGTTATTDPTYGNINSVPLACCDQNAAAISSCTLGTCAATACSASQLHGACNADDYCSNGNCIPAPCSPFFAQGACSAGDVCISGHCTLPNCLSQNDPNAYCAPLVCGSNNACVTPPCSVSNTSGFCSTSGQICCDSTLVAANDPNCVSGMQGSCIYPTCSATYPGAGCPASNQVCAGGTCEVPPCSTAYPTGACPVSFTCAAGTCQQNACSGTSPEGYCNDQNQRCAGAAGCQLYECSGTFPNAPCRDVSQLCVAGSPPTCQKPACSAQYPGGQCSNSNQICAIVSGVVGCYYPSCSSTYTHGTCPAQQSCCDASAVTSRNCALGTCVPDLCSPTNVSGHCPPQSVCCNSNFVTAGVCSNPNIGTCVQQICTPTYPAGQCLGANAGKVCINGGCLFPCTTQHLTGYCPANFACVEGGCSVSCQNDQDCDNISDSVEGYNSANPAASTTTTPGASPDYLNRDSDGDGIPDRVERGGTNPNVTPLQTTSGIYDFRNIDSDGDHISDTLEATTPLHPVDTDNDGLPDYRDIDSDNDGILDKCEATDKGSPAGLCANTTLITGVGLPALQITNTNGLPDFRNLDSDGDGVPDSIEARSIPSSPNTLLSTGVIHNPNQNLPPDYRYTDSDGDTLLDKDEDKNGDGIVNCQLDAFGQFVADPRTNPTCGDTSHAPFSSSNPYNYNQGCNQGGKKCLLSETSRVNADTNGNGIADPNDGIALVCAASSLKPINVFYSQTADFAFALEQDFGATAKLAINSSYAGLVFDNPVANNQGSTAVSGFVLSKTASASAIAVANTTGVPALPSTLVAKALAQSQSDMALLQTIPGASVSLVINRNFTTFDNFGAVVSQYRIYLSSGNQKTGLLRDSIVEALGADMISPPNENQNSAQDFTLLLETLYRFDSTTIDTSRTPANTPASRVLEIGALLPTGAPSLSSSGDPNALNSYSYRSLCAGQALASCNSSSRPGCFTQNGACVTDPNYQLPLFYADNISNGSGVTQYGNDVAALCQSLIQQNGLLDFMWVVDNSISMAPKINQVSEAAATFFALLSNTEADYRVGMLTTSPSSMPQSDANLTIWQPVYPGCSGITSQTFCETGKTSGGCTWDSNVSMCFPRCTRYTTNANCLADATQGCVWQSNTCSYGGCGAYTNASTCQVSGYCNWNASSNTCVMSSLTDRSNGQLVADFTGAMPGNSTSFADRTTSYDCNDGCSVHACDGIDQFHCGLKVQCNWDSTAGACVTSCCAACLANPGTTVNDPACFFAARLPDDTGNAFEFGLLMAEWALFRAGAQPSCEAFTCSPTDNTCIANCQNTSGCIWAGNTCMTGYCVMPSTNPDDGTRLNNLTAQEQECNGYIPISANNNYSYLQLPIQNSYAPTYTQSEYKLPGCAWDTNSKSCTPNIGAPCATANAPSNPWANPNAHAACNAYGPRCSWLPGNNKCATNPTYSQVLCSATDSVTCAAQAPGFCTWDTCGGYNNNATGCGAVYGCTYNAANGSCLPPAAGGVCHPIATRAARANASKVVVVLSDEEECYLKDGPIDSTAHPPTMTGKAFDGQCDFNYYGTGLFDPNDAVRLARTAAYLKFMESRNVQVFSIVGDKATSTGGLGAVDPATCAANSACMWSDGTQSVQYQNGLLPASLLAHCVDKATGLLPCGNNGGCYNAASPNTILIAEAGQGYINVAEGTGGGWGSICASNLYPSIEAMVIASVAKASPYKLSAAVQNGNVSVPVQPISPTIKVAVQTCKTASEYPGCASGTTVAVVPRSRDNGFDYDSINNSIVLYGTARAVTQGDLVVSYKYWVNRNYTPPALNPNEPPESNPACPCPEVSASQTSQACACDTGLTCGTSGSQSGGNEADQCASKTQASCNAAPWCSWNTSGSGFCEPTGICKFDPTCGGCRAGEKCDISSQSPTYGTCICDLTCGGAGCGAYETCSTTTNTSDPTCGKCICDTTCGGGCPAGQICSTSGSTCGQCECDTTCSQTTCGATEQCNSDPSSATCGFCQPKQCPACASGQTCDLTTGQCVCDITCDGGCADGKVCDSSSSSATCGQCLCQPDCGNISCGAGQVCDQDASSVTCGLCKVDTTCGGVACEPACTATTQATCVAQTGCNWGFTSATTRGCFAATCKQCSSATGLCEADPTCCNSCGPNQACDSSSGACICDTTCKGSCGVGMVCDSNATDAACGACVCDTTCGGSCPAGDKCDNTIGDAFCGQCVVDPNCGNGCTFPFVCSPTTGLCGPDPKCGGCPAQYRCNSATGVCQAGGGG